LGLLLLVLGLAVFIGGHVFVTRRQTRATLVARIGEGPYKGLFSLVAVAGVVIAGYGFGLYRATGLIDVWHPPAWTRHVAALLVWLAVIGFVAAYIRGNIYRMLKHPMLTGTKAWAAGHLIANGDLGAILLFGAVLGWAVFDRISLKRRSDPGAPPIPVGGLRNDVIAVVVATIVFFLLGYYFHPLIIGVKVFGS
jgi:uncharacterized membrane protein